MTGQHLLTKLVRLIGYLNVEISFPDIHLVALVKPYVFAILPSGTVPISQVDGPAATSASAFIPSPVIEIRSSISLSTVQTIPFPPTAITANASTASHSIRLLTPSPTSKSPLFVVSTPTDRTAAANSGSAIWRFQMKPWNQQIDELVEGGAYTDALALLDSLDAALVADKVGPAASIWLADLTKRFVGTTTEASSCIASRR